MAKTVWISGASRGIGKSAAVHFAARLQDSRGLS